MAKLKKPLVVLGLIGTSLDRGRGSDRWNRWRPSVAACQHGDLVVDRFELIHDPKFTAMSELVREDVALVSPKTTLNLHAMAIADPWDFEEVYGALFEFASQYPFDLDREEYLIHITTGTHVAQICLFLLTEARYLPARLLQTSPPRGVNDPAHGCYALVDLDLSKYDRLATRFHQEQQESLSFLKSGIATRNRAFNALIEQIERVALCSTDAMLLMGPTGAGKSQLARRIYELKKARRQTTGAFVEINCATIRGDAAMSALFGHVKGSFTGAMRDRDGLLKAAHGGLLFLDEIGELGADEQAMLLRALEDRVFLPLGSDREVRSDFQLIAGTNRDLQVEVREGRFREDLLARINLWTYRLPGLRERQEDIGPNLDYELEKFAKRANRRVTFNKEARTLYEKFAISPSAAWKANFRDLNASVTRLATLSPAGRISVEAVEEELTRLRHNWANLEEPGCTATVAAVLAPEQCAEIDPFDLAQLAYVIEVCRQSATLSEAGRKLFAVSREKRAQANDADRLRKYLLRFGLDWKTVREAR